MQDLFFCRHLCRRQFQFATRPPSVIWISAAYVVLSILCWCMTSKSLVNRRFELTERVELLGLSAVNGSSKVARETQSVFNAHPVLQRCENFNMNIAFPWSPKCSTSVIKVYFLVKNLAFGSAHQRGIQPAFALKHLYGVETSVIDCMHFCKPKNVASMNEHFSLNSNETKVFIHMDVPCRCVHEKTKDPTAFHIMEIMDTLSAYSTRAALDSIPEGFHQFIVATEIAKTMLSLEFSSKGLRTPVNVVPYHDSNLLGRGTELHAALGEPVRHILYMGSKPDAAMMSRVRKFLAAEYSHVKMHVIGPEIADKAVSPLTAQEMKTASVDDLWPHSLTYSDVFASRMSLPGAIAIVWDQCSQYTNECSKTADTRCLYRQRALCLGWKDNGRLLVHLAMGMPTVVYDEYLSHKELLRDHAYPLTASSVDDLILRLSEVIQNSTLRTVSSSIGMEITAHRSLCSTAKAYFNAICSAVVMV